MKINRIYLTAALLFCTSILYAQFGIKAGVNMAKEITTFSQPNTANGFISNSLTGYQLGLIYQTMPKKSGLGIEIGLLLSQEGSTFHYDSTAVGNPMREGYNELNYLVIPLNIRYRLSLGAIGVYGFGGVYGGYALSGKTVTETANITENQTFQRFIDHVDYGYNFGAGIELFRKIQLGATISQGLRNTANTSLPLLTTTTNRVVTVNLVYLF